MTDTSIVVDANDLRERGEAYRTIELTTEDQVAAVKRIGEMMSMLAAVGRPVEEIVKAAQLSVIGSVVNISLLATVADAKAFVEHCLLPTLDKLALEEANILAEADLSELEPQGNA